MDDTLVYDYKVDWGDDTTPIQHTEDATHTFAHPGLYTIKISGDFPAIHFDETFRFYDYLGFSPAQIVSVDQWGDIRWKSMNSAFAYLKDLDIAATDAPDLSNVTDMSFMFQFSTFNGDISTWDTSSVIDWSYTFEESAISDENYEK